MGLLTVGLGDDLGHHKLTRWRCPKQDEMVGNRTFSVEAAHIWNDLLPTVVNVPRVENATHRFQETL